ncbi:MAG TPA: shikimate kinase [Gemmatimonadales bacterium]|nr:shikimate kinase [Gemmatimonadales bacterium]
MKRHIVLVGLPGAGKTTVGKLVAEKLGTQVIDIDALVVRKMQMPVARIFAEHGEAKFRILEAEAMRQAVGGTAAVITPGGGWVAQPGALEETRDTCYLVYLRTMASTAAKRSADYGRPLLMGEDPLEKMRQLLKEREPYYSKAHAEVKADVKAPPALADDVVQLAKAHAGW